MQNGNCLQAEEIGVDLHFFGLTRIQLSLEILRRLNAGGKGSLDIGSPDFGSMTGSERILMLWRSLWTREARVSSIVGGSLDRGDRARRIDTGTSVSWKGCRQRHVHLHVRYHRDTQHARDQSVVVLCHRRARLQSGLRSEEHTSELQSQR